MTLGRIAMEQDDSEFRKPDGMQSSRILARRVLEERKAERPQHRIGNEVMIILMYGRLTKTLNFNDLGAPGDVSGPLANRPGVQGGPGGL